MRSELRVARKFANQIRFAGDVQVDIPTSNPERSNELKDLFYCTELCVTNEVTPELYCSLQSALKRLRIPNDSVEAFVYASPDINAQCYSGLNSECVIRFTSALVDILDNNEFEFVVGHELGHFLLSHSMGATGKKSVEYYMRQRGQEISADRLGLIACNSLEVAVKALIKTISGLSDHHLRFDVGAFLSQLRKTSSSVGQDQRSTHPSILVRCRALLWFSLNESFTNNSRTFTSEGMLVLDKRIQNDFDKYVDSSVRERIDEAKHDLSMWLAAHEIVKGGSFSKKDQVRFGNSFGDVTLEKLIRFLSDIPKSKIDSSVSSKVNQARQQLESLIPYSFERELKELSNWNS